ncbi:hypothetical protein FA13DRAFT_1019503 [Coprinellus micaceus]|uniref:Uncharacterized protein n=1 Tax=Coprinellus micaceus TaxID=71717 RepID=A0A4Y7SXV7_COPMI|nr:hypothetical protein FA13DRAFT_1019503 [Coprinellus micaceus]
MHLTRCYSDAISHGGLGALAAPASPNLAVEAPSFIISIIHSMISTGTSHSFILVGAQSCSAGYEWSNNQLGQNPCQVMQRAQSALRFSAPGGDGVFNPPTSGNQSPGFCSGAYWLLVSSCADCSGHGYHSWSTWKGRCNPSNVYPHLWVPNHPECLLPCSNNIVGLRTVVCLGISNFLGGLMNKSTISLTETPTTTALRPNTAVLPALLKPPPGWRLRLTLPLLPPPLPPPPPLLLLLPLHRKRLLLIALPTPTQVSPFLRPTARPPEPRPRHRGQAKQPGA